MMKKDKAQVPVNRRTTHFLPLGAIMLAGCILPATAQEQGGEAAMELPTVNVQADADRPDGYRATTTRVGKVLQLSLIHISWYLIITKGIQSYLSQKHSHDFLDAFWRAPNLDTVARRLREHGVNEPYSHLVHHGRCV